MRRIALLPLVCLTLIGCQTEASGEIDVADGWVRAMPSETSDRTAAYFTIKNETGREIRLEDIAVEGATAELHTTTVEDDVARMRQVEHLAVPSGGSASLFPSGDHVMLLGLQERLVEGDSLHMTLLFDSGQDIHVTLPVEVER